METNTTLTAKEALENRNDVDYRAYCLIINEILPWIQYSKEFKQWYDETREWEGATADLMENIESIKKDRMYANEAFANAIREKRF